MTQKLSQEATAKKRAYCLQYAATKLKRIPLDVQKKDYKELKAAAETVGEPVNTYIKTAIRRRMETGD